MVERSIAWLVANGHRWVRDRSTDLNRRWLDHRVAAVNLRHLIRGGLTPPWNLGDRLKGWWARG
jgi:hypothetical protein